VQYKQTRVTCAAIPFGIACVAGVTAMHFPIPSGFFTAVYGLSGYGYGHYGPTNFPMLWPVPLTHNLWGFRNEGLLSIPQIKHMTYATMLLFYCSYCLLHTSFRIRLISVFSINTYYVLLYL
jgi:hypothetical protein